MAGWHLEYTIDVDKPHRVVYEKIFGIWRVETAEAYLADYEEEVAPLLRSKKPWVKLCDLSNWKTAYPEVIAIIGRHLKWCQAHNMQWSVNVLNNPATFRQLHQMFDKGGTRDISAVFRTYKEGLAFLKKEGYAVGQSSGGSLRRSLGGF